MFGTFVDQAKWFIALSYVRFVAIHRETHSKVSFKKTLLKGRKVFALEVLKSNTLWETDKGNNSPFI